MIEVEPTEDGGFRLVSERFDSEQLARHAAETINFHGMLGLARLWHHHQATCDFQRVLADGETRPLKAELHLTAAPGRPTKVRLLFEAEPLPAGPATGK